MNRTTLALILFSVVVTAAAQIVLKAGMTGDAVRRAIDTGFGYRTIAIVFLNPLVISGLLLYFGAAMVWLVVLTRAPVSVAYPFVALGFVLTALFGKMLFQEELTSIRIVAIFLICIGVALLARD